MASWPKALVPKIWTAYSLARECFDYEESQKQTQEMIRQYREMPALSDNETEVDMEEAEDYMNNLPSPKQTMSIFWTPEYQARREARKRLWSPPLTPPLPGMPTHSLQPSQRTPPSKRRRRQSSPSPNRQNPTSPAASSHIQLQRPPEGRHNKIRKTKPSPRPRRPTTRSMKSSRLLSLHSQKGLVTVTPAAGRGHSVTPALNTTYHPPASALPNPLPIPSTPYSIDFDPSTTELYGPDARASLLTAFHNYQRYIQTHSCGSQPLEPREWRYGTAIFGIAPAVAQRGGGPLIWNDALKIVEAFRLKGDVEGYKSRWGAIVVTEARRTVVGTALLGEAMGREGGRGGVDTA
ncbi:MAG: hypothetical protein Q9220_003511 [cf. Caloplaca sp. 1 TL-2023]